MSNVPNTFTGWPRVLLAPPGLGEPRPTLRDLTLKGRTTNPVGESPELVAVDDPLVLAISSERRRKA